MLLYLPATFSQMNLTSFNMSHNDPAIQDTGPPRFWNFLPVSAMAGKKKHTTGNLSHHFSDKPGFYHTPPGINNKSGGSVVSLKKVKYLYLSPTVNLILTFLSSSCWVKQSKVYFLVPCVMRAKSEPQWGSPVWFNVRTQHSKSISLSYLDAKRQRDPVTRVECKSL